MLGFTYKATTGADLNAEDMFFTSSSLLKKRAQILCRVLEEYPERGYIFYSFSHGLWDYLSRILSERFVQHIYASYVEVVRYIHIFSPPLDISALTESVIQDLETIFRVNNLFPPENVQLQYSFFSLIEKTRMYDVLLLERNTWK